MSTKPVGQGEEPTLSQADGGRTTLSVSVVEALANAEGVEPGELDLVLSDIIDPEALDTLYDRYADDEGERWSFAFTTDKHLVTVNSDGTILIE